MKAYGYRGCIAPRFLNVTSRYISMQRYASRTAWGYSRPVWMLWWRVVLCNTTVTVLTELRVRNCRQKAWEEGLGINECSVGTDLKDNGEMILKGENPSTWRKICSSANLSLKNLTWTDLVSKAGPGGESHVCQCEERKKKLEVLFYQVLPDFLKSVAFWKVSTSALYKYTARSAQ